jgi:LCP family protein required for cell wall assembly
VLAAAVSIAIFGGVVFGAVRYRVLDHNITRVDAIGDTRTDGTARPEKAKGAAKNSRNVLIVGSDSRDSGLPTDPDDTATGQRSDTIIVAHLYAGSDTAELISFPRDSWVTIPAYTDEKTKKTTAAHQAKINSAISTGGPALLVSTIEELTDLRIDNYVEINFKGFQTMVNDVGGVEVCLNKAAKDQYSGINLPKGTQTIKGAQALAFVRQRHGLPNGDIDRIARQQHFIGSLARKVLSSGTLLNPVKLNNLATAASNNLTTDTGTGLSDLIDIGQRLSGFAAGGIAFTTVPYTDIGAVRGGGQSVVLLDDAKMKLLFDQLRADKVPAGLAGPAPAATGTPTTPPSSGLTIAPKNIRVTVLNGAGVKGLGAKAATSLGDQGFVISGTPGNRGTGASTTVVRYGPTKADSARTVAASIPGATLQQVASLGSTLEVVVGSDFTAAVPVTIDGVATTPTPSATTTPPPLETAADTKCVN